MKFFSTRFLPSIILLAGLAGTVSGQYLTNDAAYKAELATKPLGIPYLTNPTDWKENGDGSYTSPSTGYKVSSISNWAGATTPDNAMDGNPSTIVHTKDHPGSGKRIWFELDLGKPYDVSSFAILNRHNIKTVLNEATVYFDTADDESLYYFKLPGKHGDPGAIRYAYKNNFKKVVHDVQVITIMQTVPSSGCIANTMAEGGGRPCANWINFSELNIAAEPTYPERTKAPEVTKAPVDEDFFKLFGPDETKGVIDWDGGKKFCEDKGMQLPTHAQWCVDDVPMGGITGDHSMAPIADRENAWLYVTSTSDIYKCRTWKEITGRPATWGDDGKETRKYENRHILCAKKLKDQPDFEDIEPHDFHWGGCPSDSWWPKLGLDGEILCAARDKSKHGRPSKYSFDTVEEATKDCVKRGGVVDPGFDKTWHGKLGYCRFKRLSIEPRHKDSGKTICPAPFYYHSTKDGKVLCNGTWGSRYSWTHYRDLCPKAGGTWKGSYHSYDCYFPAPEKDASSYGEPHFNTWAGEKYDFQGGCDLVLLQNPDFANGLGMNIHIRTKISKWWSSIESAVVQIGQDTLEVKGSKNDGATVWINNDWKMDLQTGDFSLGDYPVHFRRVNGHHTSARIDIGNGDAIGIESFKDFVRVNTHDTSNKAFVGSHGLLGAYPTGEKVGRDGKTVFDNTDDFGQEWQRLASEPNLFHTMEGAVEPSKKCPMPTTSKSAMRRRLAEGSVTQEDAEVACARVNLDQRDACIFDVLATQDKDMAGSY